MFVKILFIVLSVVSMADSIAFGVLEIERDSSVLWKRISLSMAMLSAVFLLIPLWAACAHPKTSFDLQAEQANVWTVKPFTCDKEHDWYEVTSDNGMDFLVNNKGYPIRADGTVWTKEYQFLPDKK